MRIAGLSGHGQDARVGDRRRGLQRYVVARRDAVRARDWLGLGVVTAVIIALSAVSVYCWRSARGVVRRRYAYAFISIMWLRH